MQNSEEPKSAETVAEQPIPEEVTKRSVRVKVWRHLERNGLSLFPRPVYNRIPNFKGSLEATNRLCELDIFKNSTSIKVNPDKSQEPVRQACLQQEKTLYVSVPYLNDGLMSRMVLPADESGPQLIRKAVSRKGMETYGKPVALDENISLDLVVIGCVAVSKDGFRIGKGRGYADLEFGMMVHMKAIKPNTIIATTVHDSQVYDTLPADLFGPHDVPIDIIVTPTQVIETQRLSQRPTGILWHLLSNRRIQLMPVLAELRKKEMLAGRPCTLKEVDTDVEEMAAQRKAQRSKRYQRRNRSSNQNNSESEPNEVTEKEGGAEKEGRRRPLRNKPRQPRPSPDPAKRNKKPKPVIDFSVKVSNIERSTRVRDLKQALAERGVKPQIMTWKGFRGYCYLHFIKPNQQKGEGDTNVTVESVCTALAELALGTGEGEGEATTPHLLTVEPAKPVRRIETTDVTAV